MTWTETHPFADPNNLHEDQTYYNEHYVYPEQINGINALTHVGNGVVIAGGGAEFTANGYSSAKRGQLSRSTDYGATWTKVRYLPSTPQLQGNDIFFIEKLSNGNIYIGVNYISHTKLFKSSDDGLTWTKLGWNEPLEVAHSTGYMQVKFITGITELSNGRVLVSGGSPIYETSVQFGTIFSFIDVSAFEACDMTPELPETETSAVAAYGAGTTLWIDGDSSRVQGLSAPTGSWEDYVASTKVPDGVSYVEITFTSLNRFMAGISTGGDLRFGYAGYNSTLTVMDGRQGRFEIYEGNTSVYETLSAPIVEDGDVIGFLMNKVNNTITFYINGTIAYTANADLSGPDTVFGFAMVNTIADINFGATPFVHTITAEVETGNTILGFGTSTVHRYDAASKQHFDSNLAVVGKEASDVPGLVFAVTKTDQWPDSMRNAGVYKSTDYGLNWYHVRGEAEDLTVSMYAVPEYIGGGRLLTGTAVQNTGYANARNALGGQILISDPFLDSANDPASHVSIDSMDGDRSILIDLGAGNVAGPGEDVFIQFSAPVSEAYGMEGKLGFYDKDGLEIISGPHNDATTEIKIANSVGGAITDYQATLHQPGSYVYNNNTVTASAQAGSVTTGLSDIKHITDGSIQTYWETYGFYGASSAQEWVAFGNPIDVTSDTISLHISWTDTNYTHNPDNVNVFLEFDDGSQENKLITKDTSTGNFDNQEYRWFPDKIDISITGATGKKITKIGFWGANFSDNIRLWAIEMDGGIVGNVSGATPDSSYGPALIQEKVLRLDIIETTRGVRYIKMPVISAQSIEKVMKHRM